LTGFFAAVLIGAVLSSFNSALNSTATLFSLGVYKGMFRPDASDVATIRVGKVFGTVIAIAAMAGAPFLLRQESIFQYLQGFRSVYAIPILSLVVASIWFQKIPAWAANLVIVLGGAGVVLHALGDQFEPALGFNLKAMTEAASVHQWHYNASVFVGTVGLLWAAAKFTPSTRVLPERPAPPIDMTPWPLAKPAGCAIVATVFAIYIYFAVVTVVDWLPWYEAGQ
ncbi:MAG: solute:sodium symporter family transporter, partial [Planctomycetota bacterium]